MLRVPPVHRTRSTVLVLAGALAVGGLVGVTAANPAVAAACDEAGTTVTCSFDNSDAAESFLVPAGVTSAQMTLQGGSGGNGAALVDGTPAPDAGGKGSSGGITRAAVSLLPGSTLRIFVGGKGGNGGGCDDEFAGTRGRSGGIPTGGVGGGGKGPPGNPSLCAGGGGGGASFVMLAGQSPTEIAFTGGAPTGVTPVLVAGGGGGGGGGAATSVSNDGGAGGGTSSGLAADGEGKSGGAGGATDSAEGATGTISQSPGQPKDAGGGGGGGFPGGAGGGIVAAAVGSGNTPGSGGGGGEAYPASKSATPAGQVAAAGEPGSITISYEKPTADGPNNTDTDTCVPFDKQCVVAPPAGEETRFKVRATGGKREVTLVGVLNGGVPPTCKSVGGTLSPDWAQFGFTSPEAGKSWAKKIRATGTEAMSKRTARQIKAQSQICFAAPYRFVVQRGTQLGRPSGGPTWEGLLAHCRSDIIRQAELSKPNLERPCIIKRTLVKRDGGWVVRVIYSVPKNDMDPQGRTLKKKKKR